MDRKGQALLWVSCLLLAGLFCAGPAFSQGVITLPCEVMESSEPLKSSVANLNGVRYLLLHHANSADRDTLSQWLSDHSGAEVTFAFKGVHYKGILCRLANCFGRGLLIYAADVQLGKRDIIHVDLPKSP